MSDAENLEIKKRARRRLVGAIALALLAAVVLPVMMDQEPHPSMQDIQITIPDRDKVAALPSPAPQPAPGNDGGVATVVPVPEDDGVATAESAPPPVAAPAPAKPPAAGPTPPKAVVVPEAPRLAAPARSAEEEARVRAILAGEPVPPRSESFVVQVGAFSDAAKAAKLVDELKAKGFSAYTEPAGQVTRVRVGPVAGREAADKVVGRLKAAGHQAVLQAR